MDAFQVTPLDLHFHTRAVGAIPLDSLLAMQLRPVFCRIDGDKQLGGHGLALDTADDMQRLARRELGIHTRGRDAHALLTTRLTQLVEPGAIQQLAENARDLVFHDPGAVILDHHAENVVPVIRDLHLYLRQ